MILLDTGILIDFFKGKYKITSRVVDFNEISKVTGLEIIN